MQVDQENVRLETANLDDDAEVFGGKSLPLIDTTLSNEEYVNICIKRALKFFNTESGNNEAKKQNLGDNKYTKIDTPLILREYPSGALHSELRQIVSGNIKALVPLSRELLTPEPMPGNE